MPADPWRGLGEADRFAVNFNSRLHSEGEAARQLRRHRDAKSPDNVPLHSPFCFVMAFTCISLEHDPVYHKMEEYQMEEYQI
jgi:hypothetical protein